MHIIIIAAAACTFGLYAALRHRVGIAAATVLAAVAIIGSL